MNALLDPMNKTPRRAVVGGRHLPPAANLTGRAGACQILGIDKRSAQPSRDCAPSTTSTMSEPVRNALPRPPTSPRSRR